MAKTIECCAHCGQKMMVYQRSIRVGMVFAMREVLYSGKTKAFKVSDFSWKRGVSADFTKLKYWRLIELVGPETWKITHDGIKFLIGQLRVSKYKYIYNNTVQQDPENETNPLISVVDVDPKQITKESVLRDAARHGDFINPTKQMVML